jgi:hypothetical protein
MKFARPLLAKEFDARLHPEARQVVLDLDAYSELEDLPLPVVTAISRAPDWYAANGLKPNPNSWHLYDCAVDLRNSHYSAEHLHRVCAWLKNRCLPPERWELVFTLHGTGPHLHIAKKDWSWRATFAKTKANA